jgi:hypothetical protein
MARVQPEHTQKQLIHPKSKTSPDKNAFDVRVVVVIALLAFVLSCAVWAGSANQPNRKINTDEFISQKSDTLMPIDKVIEQGKLLRLQYSPKAAKLYHAQLKVGKNDSQRLSILEHLGDTYAEMKKYKKALRFGINKIFIVIHVLVLMAY